jgi:hypothetical protein
MYPRDICLQRNERTMSIKGVNFSSASLTKAECVRKPLRITGCLKISPLPSLYWQALFCTKSILIYLVECWRFSYSVHYELMFSVFIFVIIQWGIFFNYIISIILIALNHR